jgi:hypothetical protein
VRYVGGNTLVQLVLISLTFAFAATSHCAAQHKVSGPLSFGFDSKIEALAPPAGFFQYCVNAETRSLYRDKLPLNLEPSPPENPPAGVSYPLSQVWKLRESNEHLTGYCYSCPASENLKDRASERDRMLRLATPQGAIPRWSEDSNSYNLPQIPGMVQMIPGVSYCVDLQGDPEDSIFVAACHTAESLRLHGEEGMEAVQILESLRKIVWGDLKSGKRPLYALEGLKVNDRSARASTSAPYTGSFSLGSTLEKGFAVGKQVPAVQPTYHEIVETLNTLHLHIGRLYRLISKFSLSKRERDLMDFYAISNNLFSLGGLGPAPLSIQMNSSFVTNVQDLIKHIGAVQGRWHTDQLDHVVFLTMFVLFVRLPKGKIYTYLLLLPS